MLDKIKLVVIIINFLVFAYSQPSEDTINGIPGYSADFQNRAFAGYLDTSSDLRKLHYVFVQGDKGVDNNSPVLLWLNGGPGCISKIGFVQQISSYCLNDSQKYNTGDSLTFNPYGWTNLANILFIDSPAGVGFSLNNDPQYQYNDANTVKDNLFALKFFFKNKFPEYANNTFYIAGESYAGKYIPDLAVKILTDNQNNPTPININGILVGNGILNWQDLQYNRVQYMISHNFVDPKLLPYWQRSCKTDADSAGCRFFYERFEDFVYRIDEYNIYGDCYGRKGPPQKSLMAELSLRFSKFYEISQRYGPASEKNLKGDWCSYDLGIQNYLNINKDAFHSQKKQSINVCNMTIFKNYVVNQKGSMKEMASLLQQKIKIYLFNGDWDDVVPFTDTYKNLERLGLKVQGSPQPWMVGGQHAGFIKKYSYGLMFYLVKGAGHEAPMYQRERTYRMFQKFIYDV